MFDVGSTVFHEWQFLGHFFFIDDIISLVSLIIAQQTAKNVHMVYIFFMFCKVVTSNDKHDLSYVVCQRKIKQNSFVSFCVFLLFMRTKPSSMNGKNTNLCKLLSDSRGF